MVKRKSSKLKFYFRVYRAAKQELVSRGFNLKGKNKEFRAYLREQITPKFAEKKRFTKKQLEKVINETLSEYQIKIGQTPTLPKEPKGDYINPLLIPLPLVSGISWFLIDDFLDTELRAELEAIDPIRGLRVEINAGQAMGSTGIFNLKEYQYDANGVKNIVENVREFVENDSTPEWNGQILVRKYAKDDGDADSYYLQLTLYINGQEIAPFNSGEEAFQPIPEQTMEEKREQRRKALKIKKDREKERRQKSGQKEKRMRERPKKKEEKETPKETKKEAPSKKPSESKEGLEKIFERQENLLAQARRDYDDGIYNKTEYKKRISEINKLIEKAIEKFEKGGEV